MAAGMTVGEACRAYEGMPAPEDIFLAIHDDSAFKMRYEKALETYAYASMDKLQQEADDTSRDYVMVKGVRVPNREAVQRSKLRLDTRSKIIEYANPKRFKDREVNSQTLVLAGMDEGQAIAKLGQILLAAQQRLVRQQEAQIPDNSGQLIDVTPSTGIPTVDAAETIYAKKTPDPDTSQPVASITGRHGRGSVVYELRTESPEHDHPALA